MIHESWNRNLFQVSERVWYFFYNHYTSILFSLSLSLSVPCNSAYIVVFFETFGLGS